MFSAVLYMFVRCCMAIGPKCLRCRMFMLSGPVELLFLDFLSASVVCSVVMLMCVVCSLFMVL